MHVCNSKAGGTEEVSQSQWERWLNRVVEDTPHAHSQVSRHMCTHCCSHNDKIFWNSVCVPRLDIALNNKWVYLRVTGLAFHILYYIPHHEFLLFSMFLIRHKKLPDQVVIEVTFGFGKIFLLKIWIISVYMCARDACVGSTWHHSTGRGQRITLYNLFSLSTFMRVPGIGLGSRLEQEKPLPTEPSHRPLLSQIMVSAGIWIRKVA